MSGTNENKTLATEVAKLKELRKKFEEQLVNFGDNLRKFPIKEKIKLLIEAQKEHDFVKNDLLYDINMLYIEEAKRVGKEFVLPLLGTLDWQESSYEGAVSITAPIPDFLKEQLGSLFDGNFSLYFKVLEGVNVSLNNKRFELVGYNAISYSIKVLGLPGQVAKEAYNLKIKEG